MISFRNYCDAAIGVGQHDGLVITAALACWWRVAAPCRAVGTPAQLPSRLGLLLQNVDQGTSLKLAFRYVNVSSAQFRKATILGMKKSA